MIPKPMNIFVDENIPHAKVAFSPLGSVTLFTGRSLSRNDLQSCDALIVRSVTRVDRSLVAGTPVKFVATATAGTEHVNEADLAELGIAFASAPGSNADSVVAWVLSGLSHLTRDHGLSFAGLPVGVVGCGNVGGRLCRALTALGASVKRVDPPLQKARPHEAWHQLKDLADCRLVTFHVPHVEGGPHPTLGMVNVPFLGSLKARPFLFNASRGEVVDEKALLSAMDRGQVAEVALDVWHGEPAIDLNLLDRVRFGTPHVAGYATTAKFKGLQMVVDALARHFGKNPGFDWKGAFGSVEPLAIPPNPGEPLEAWARRLILSIYDLDRDSRALKAARAEPAGAPALFDRLRKEYPRRLDLDCQPLDPRGLSAEHLALARGLSLPF